MELGLKALSTWKTGTAAARGLQLLSDCPGRAQTLDPGQRPGGGFPSMPGAPLAGTPGGTLVGGDLMTHFKLLLIRLCRFLLLPSFRLDPQSVRGSWACRAERGDSKLFFTRGV